VKAVNMKMEKAMKSALVTPEYLLTRMGHSPSNNKTAGMRWE
jgi:hypothetical protein